MMHQSCSHLLIWHSKWQGSWKPDELDLPSDCQFEKFARIQNSSIWFTCLIANWSSVFNLENFSHPSGCTRVVLFEDVLFDGRLCFEEALCRIYRTSRFNLKLSRLQRSKRPNFKILNCFPNTSVYKQSKVQTFFNRLDFLLHEFRFLVAILPIFADFSSFDSKLFDFRIKILQKHHFGRRKFSITSLVTNLAL